ncbi:MAG TPA: preprotein translocase subunit SecA, partial [Bacillota bacterium]|nr:preprotein translocase subunit SecA [Bacillota bacterium]
DVTYGTNNEYGFDYLRDNMVIYKERIAQREHQFAIVDEVDSILIDEARTPLIISGPGEESTTLYDDAEKFVRRLRVYRIKELDSKETHEDIDADYIVDEKARTAVLTTYGIKKAEEYFHVDNLADADNATLMHHINIAIRARGVMQRDVDYVVKDGQVLIVDSFTGRIMMGRRFSDGLHQAIEAKEGVKIERENKTQATITFQNYFRMYKKLSGMTGTALTEEDEFREIYGLDVVEIPTNKPLIRKDNVDSVYRSVNGKYTAVIRQIEDCHAKGQPVLVGTVSIEKSEALSKILTKKGIPHNVLNAKYHEREAEIVAQAGTFGAVTISTNMAGRGTDIKLGGNSEFLAKEKMTKEGYSSELISAATAYFETDDQEIIDARAYYTKTESEFAQKIKPEAEKVREAGGLYILGTERHESRRIDNQLRGRSGRQGDPGESKFFISLEDDLMRLFGSDRVNGIVATLGLAEDQPIDARILSNSIEAAQKRLEGTNFERRKNIIRFDDVMNQQRTIIYTQRREVLNGADLRDKMVGMIEGYIDDVMSKYTSSDIPDEWNTDGLRGALYGVLCGDDDFKYDQKQLNEMSRDKLREELVGRAMTAYKKRETELFTTEQMREIERVILLRNVDRSWIDHIDAMDDLMSGIGLRAYSQRDPVVEYKIEGSTMFEDMINNIRESTVRQILTVAPRQKIQRQQIMTAANASLGGGDKKIKVQPVRHTKVGANDPCPCGSGKKYKYCCMGK